ncbi:MAG: class I SAM-dependent methyltransferase [Betaproteobacteria bacterium]|nr:class I SAM-dependent methyltransferase [Betaproteobacteria bacterium]
MSELVHSRDLALAELGKQKRNIALPPDELQRIDRALVDRWQIEFVDTRAFLLEYLESLPPSAVRTNGLAAFGADLARQKKDGSFEQHVYAAMVEPELCGIITSGRRHYLLDAVAMACAMYRRLRLSGPVLDVGCHIGVAPDLIADALCVHVVGIEPVNDVVAAAQVRFAGRADVSIVRGAVPWQTDKRFELVTAIDSMPLGVGDRSSYLKGISQLLQPGGLAIIVSAYWIDADVTVIRRQLDMAGLGFGLADVVGGYGGMPTGINVEGCVCLIKGGKRQFPRKIGAEMESEWEWFKHYATLPDTPAREKTRAFMRSALTKHYPNLS